MIFQSATRIARLTLWAGLVASTTLVAPASANDDFICNPTADPMPICAVAATGMVLRVLMRPGARIHVEMDEASGTINAQPEAFSVYYAFDAVDVSYDENFSAQGWFRVGSGGFPEGFVQAKDVVPWKQALALAFTNPGPADRRQVLMFQDQASLQTTVEQVLVDPAAGTGIYDKLATPPAPNGIVSAERTTWVDVMETFYLMPILDYADFSKYAPGLQAVQFAALTNQAAGDQDQSCDLQQAGGANCLQQQSTQSSGTLGADIVFVIDTTSSMQQSIDAVKSSIRAMAQTLGQKAGGADNLRFGIVGYRDAMESSPGIEYTVRNFTPELLPVAEFQTLLDQNQVTSSTVGSEDWEEDVFAGMEAGIGSAWTGTGARIIVLIGDASSHIVGDAKNSRGLSEVSVRQLAEEQDVYIAAIYISDSESNADLALARPQFETMASAGSEGSPSFAVVYTAGGATTGEGSGQGLEGSLKTVMSNLADLFLNGNVAALTSAGTAAGDQAAQAVMGTIRAAVVDYLGSEATPPPSIIAWATDKDLTAFEKQAFDVRVLVGKSEMQTLTAYLEDVLGTFRGGQSTSTGFLSGVVAGAATTTLDLNINQAEPLIASPQAPNILKNLPYKSEVLSLSIDEFRAASAEDRARFEQRLETLIALYKDVDTRPESWVQLNKGADGDDKYFMLSLRDLP